MTFHPTSVTMLASSGFAWSQRPPEPSLARFVSTYYELATCPGHHLLQTLPDGCVDLVLRLDGAAGVFLTGPQRRARSIRFRGARRLIGARLLPGSAALLGIDVGALPGGWTPVQELMSGPPVAKLMEAAGMQASATAVGVAALQGFLADQLRGRRHDSRFARAHELVCASRGDISIAELSRRSGAHPRTLARLFERHMGVGPKRFARVVRLQTAFRKARLGTSLAQVAQELGYTDQAHFVHDARELLGASPTEFLARAGRTR